MHEVHTMMHGVCVPLESSRNRLRARARVNIIQEKERALARGAFVSAPAQERHLTKISYVENIERRSLL